MAKKSNNPIDALIENASEKTSKSKAKIPVIACTGKIADNISTYLQLMQQESDIKAQKESIGGVLRDEARSLFAKEMLQKTDASSIRMSAKEDALLFTVQDSYSKVSAEKKEALVAEGLGSFIETKVTIDFDSANEQLQAKVAALLVANLSKEEQAMLIKTEQVVSKGALKEACRDAKSVDEVLNIITLLAPTQQLKKG